MPERKRMELTDKQRAIVLARIKAAKDKAAERDKNHDEDSALYPQEGARNLALLGGVYWAGINRTDVRSVNHMAPVAISKFALVTNGRREFLARSTRPRFDELTDVARGVLNHTWRSLDLEKEFKLAFWDVAALKMGVVEIGWVFESSDHEETRGVRPDVAVPEDAEPVMTADGQMMEPRAMEFSNAEEAQRAAETADDYVWNLPRRDDPFVERFDPRDLLLDPECIRADLSDCRYAFRRKVSRIADLKRNKAYRNTRDLKATCSMYGGKPDESGGVYEVSSDQAKSDFDATTVYDGYVWLSLKEGAAPKFLHIVMAEGVDKELLVEPFPYEWVSRNPYPFELLLNWRPSNDSLEPASDVSQTRNLQIEHDESYTQVSTMRRRGASKWAGPPLEAGHPVLEALEDGEEGKYVPMEEGLLNRIKPLERQPRNMEAFAFLEAVPDHMRAQWGVNEFQLNSIPDKETKATEVQMLASQGGTRQQMEVDNYNEFCCRGAYKVLALLQQFSERARHFSYVSESGEETWGQATLESLRGVDPRTGELEPVGIQFAIEIDSAATGMRNKFSERKELTEMVGALVPLLQMPDPARPGLPMINLRPLLRDYLKSFDLPNINDVIAPEPDENDKLAMALQMLQQAGAVIDQLKSKLAEMEAAVAGSMPAGMPGPAPGPAPGPPMPAAGPEPEVGGPVGVSGGLPLV